MPNCPGCGEPVGGTVFLQEENDDGVVSETEFELRIEFEQVIDGRFIGRVVGDPTVLHECSFGSG
jgi:hypothetical protein